MRPEWSGEKIFVSYISHDDLGGICNMLAKDSVCRWLFFGPNSPETTIAYFSPLIEQVSASVGIGGVPESPVFTIRERDSGRFAGQCAILPVDFSPGTYLIGYQIDDPFHGMGFGTESCEFLVYYAFTLAGAYRLNGDAAYGNTASWRSAGFHLRGEGRNTGMPAGSTMIRFCMGF